MRFTEHELTVAVTSAAKVVAGGKIGRRRARTVHAGNEDAWEAMSKIDRYHLLEAVGSQVLPVLLALPDIEVEAGTRPTFTDEEIATAVEQTMGETGVGRLGSKKLRAKVAVAARLTLVRTALAQLPVRQDPDALIVPDHL